MAANLSTVAWKGDETDNGIVYNVQINDITYKFRKPIEEAMKDWKKVSYGWNIKDSTEVFIFRKTFRNEQEWINWAQKFPLTVKEKRFWGNKEKHIIHKKAG
jgi:hypothetical protein